MCQILQTLVNVCRNHSGVKKGDVFWITVYILFNISLVVWLFLTSPYASAKCFAYGTRKAIAYRQVEINLQHIKNIHASRKGARRVTHQANHFTFLPVDHLHQLTSQSVHLFSNYHVYEFGNRQTHERMHGQTTDGQPDNIQPLSASVACSGHKVILIDIKVHSKLPYFLSPSNILPHN